MVMLSRDRENVRMRTIKMTEEEWIFLYLLNINRFGTLASTQTGSAYTHYIKIVVIWYFRTDLGEVFKHKHPLKIA